MEHCTECARLRAEAANIVAQRDAAKKRATQAEERLRAVEADLAEECDESMWRFWSAKAQALAESNETLRAERDNLKSWKNYWQGEIDVILAGRADECDRADAAEAELARIRAADRTSITVRTTEAAKMRKGQAI